MTPKEKAEELVKKYLFSINVQFTTSGFLELGFAKICALKTIDEIIAEIEPSISMDVIASRINYWQEVKQEIEKL